MFAADSSMGCVGGCTSCIAGYLLNCSSKTCNYVGGNTVTNVTCNTNNNVTNTTNATNTTNTTMTNVTNITNIANNITNNTLSINNNTNMVIFNTIDN